MGFLCQGMLSYIDAVCVFSCVVCQLPLGLQPNLRPRACASILDPRSGHRVRCELTYSELGTVTSVPHLVHGSGSEMSLCGLHRDAIPAQLRRMVDLRLAVLKRIDAATAEIGQMIMEINKDVFVADPSGDLSRAPFYPLPAPSQRSLINMVAHWGALLPPNPCTTTTCNAWGCRNGSPAALLCSGSQRSAVTLTGDDCQLLMTVSGAGALRSCWAGCPCPDQIHPKVMCIPPPP